MVYRFKPGDTSVQDGVRRIALGQIREALAGIDDRALPRTETIHEARKHCKKLRGLIRLAQPAFGAYHAENAILRDAAKALSTVRDGTAQIEACDGLIRASDDPAPRDMAAAIRRTLKERQRRVSGNGFVERKLMTFRRVMEDADERVRRWEIAGEGFEALAGGLRKSYSRARKAMTRGLDDPSEEHLHEWRKRVKDHWYHARLLQPLWPSAIMPHRRAAGRLADVLGDHHDLAILKSAIAAEPETFGHARDLQPLLGLMDRRQYALEAEAFRLGRRLFAHRPSAIRRTWHVYWDVWREEKRPQPASSSLAA